MSFNAVKSCILSDAQLSWHGPFGPHNSGLYISCLSPGSNHLFNGDFISFAVFKNCHSVGIPIPICLSLLLGLFSG